MILNCNWRWSKHPAVSTHIYLNPSWFVNTHQYTGFIWPFIHSAQRRIQPGRLAISRSSGLVMSGVANQNDELWTRMILSWLAWCLGRLFPQLSLIAIDSHQLNCKLISVIYPSTWEKMGVVWDGLLRSGWSEIFRIFWILSVHHNRPWVFTPVEFEMTLLRHLSPPWHTILT